MVPVLSLRGVTKCFPGIVANDRIDLSLWPGEVHVLLGENGAGKSTLVSVLSGLYRPDDGTIEIDGQAVRIASPRRALELGIGTVYQHSMLVPALTIAENLALGGVWWRQPDRTGIAARIRAMGDEIGIHLDPRAVVGSLSQGERQQAEIVKALLGGGRVLVLDESTSMLTPAGAQALGELMRRLAARGLAIVFITHRLGEALSYGDRLTVLRLGRKAGDMTPEECRSMSRADATAELVRLMFGSALPAPAGAPAPSSGVRPRVEGPVRPALELVGAGIDDPAMPVRAVDLAVAPGAILGIAGIDGNGQKQLAEAIAGQRPLAAGTIVLDGVPIDRLDVGARCRLGIRYVTDDRLAEGTVGSLSVATNLLLKAIGSAPFWRQGIERRTAIAVHAEALVADYDIRTRDVDTPVGTLSGGNIQKVVLARELSGPARVVIFAKPTYGLDLQNIVAIRDRIRRAADAGIAVLLISTDLDELLDLADEIAVMSGGRVVGMVRNDADARRRIGVLMVGGSP